MPSPIRPKVAILQTYVPQYRVPFFQGLRQALNDLSIDLVLAAGDPGLEDRGDGFQIEWATALNNHELRALGRRVTYRGSWGDALGADLLIAEDAVGKLDVFRYFYLRRHRGLPTALWGQGTQRGASMRETKLRARYRSLADWFFAYTETGATNVAESGFSRDRITVVNNTIDTTPLLAAKEILTVSQLSSLRREFDLTEGHTAVYLGALHESKRLDFLIRVGDEVASTDPLFRLLVLGGGPERGQVEEAAARRPWMTVVGPVFDAKRKTELITVSDVMTIPAAVGLVAVDSLALGVPILATHNVKHGPEFDYLKSGVNALVVSEDISAYSTALRLLIDDEALRTKLAAGCLKEASDHTLPAMVEAFASGVSSALDRGRESR